MANHFFSINRAADNSPNAVTAAASSTAGDDLELRIADAAGLTKGDVYILTQELLQYIDDYSVFPAN